MPRAGLNSLPRPARSALNQEVRQGSCEWLCHSWDAGSESSLVARSKKERHPHGCLSFLEQHFCYAKVVACGRVIKREWGNPSKVPSPRQVPPLRVGCAPKRALRGAALTLPLPCGGRECRQQNLWAVTERNTIRQDGVSQRVGKPTPLSFRGAKRRGNPYLFRQKPAKSAEFVRFRNGLPRQCAHWLAMTGFFDSLRNTIRQDGVFFLERAILLRRAQKISKHHPKGWPACQRTPAFTRCRDHSFFILLVILQQPTAMAFAAW